MDPHVKAAVNRYPESARNNLIHPIADVDAQIMFEIIEIFKKLKFAKVIDILKKWKEHKDDDVALDLLDLNTEMGKKQGKEVVEGAEGVEPPVLLPRYLLTCGRRIDMYLVIGYDEIDIEVDTRTQYCITLNPTPISAKQVPFYANEALVYDSEDGRKQILTLMDQFMEENKGKFIEFR